MHRNHLALLTLLVCAMCVCNALPGPLPDGYNRGTSSHRAKRTASINTDRECSDRDKPYLPPTATDTTERIRDLRDEIQAIDLGAVSGNIMAYIIPSEDAHDSEYIAGCHERRHWISGFDGSAGLAIVTHNQSAVWADGRYYLQVEQQLDCNWIVMRSSDAETQAQWDWLIDVLPPGTADEPSLVAFDPTLIAISTYNKYNNAFKAVRSDGVYIEMYPHQENLVDVIWEDQPDCPNEPLFVLDIKWTGREWYDKVTDHRVEMEAKEADMMVLHALDDTAWFFNLRGMDIPYNPVFFAYTIIEMQKTTLFVNNVSKLIVDEIFDHLIQDANDKSTFCADVNNDHKCLEILEYDDFQDTLHDMADQSSINKVWISPSASYAIYGNVNETKQYSEDVPTQVMKAVKNENEILGMHEGNLQDAVAMIEWLHWMEGAVVDADGDIDILSEISADEKVLEFRKKQPDFVMASFGSISAFGANAAIIHYSSTPETNVAITDQNVYMLDSGGQYSCGATVDTTRTMHFGTPEDRHKEAYTRVLQGAIDLSMSIFPHGRTGRDVDTHARQPLWSNGWDFNHGTGHGLGAMLNVHEGPYSIGGSRALDENVFLSDEPGYYEDHDYGIRIETVFMTTEADTPHNFGGEKYLTFEEVSFVPYDSKLIKFELLDRHQVDWLNKYNRLTLERVGPRVQDFNPEAYDWLVEQTKEIPLPNEDPATEDPVTDGTTGVISSAALITIGCFVAYFHLL